MGSRGLSSFRGRARQLRFICSSRLSGNLVRRPAGFDAWRGDAEHASGGLCSCCSIQGRMCERRLLVLRTFRRYAQELKMQRHVNF